MITVYGVYRSRALRVFWLLEEANAVFAHVPVIQSYRLDHPTAEDAPLNTASPAFRAVNPLGQVPALRDGDLLLSESLAICLHLARRTGGNLGPMSPQEEALMEQWALFAATSVEPAAIEILYTYRDKQADTPTGAGILRIAAEKLKRPLHRLEVALEGKDWLLDRFSVADIMVEECLRYAAGYGPLLQEFPNVAKWMSACQSREGFQKVWAARNAEPE